MFEDYTYERLMQEVLEHAPDDIDTREGSIFYDAVSGILLKVAKLYTDIDLIAEMTCVATACGEALDARAGEYNIKRLAATKAKYHVAFDGNMPLPGERFYTDGQYFTLKRDTDTGVYYLEAEIAGAAGNYIHSGTAAVPVNNIAGLKSAVFGTVYENGSDPEKDESLRTRVQEKISGPAENGTRQHYKTWCESVNGVGRARIFPLWNGPNTVKAVLIDTEGKPLGDLKTAEVQKYIDPAEKGYTATVNGRTYTVGDGLGEGAANLGAHFTAAAANALVIAVEFTAELAKGAEKEETEHEAAAAVGKYFKDLVMTAESAETITVRMSAIGAILSSLPSLLDYSGLKLNGQTNNIIPGEDDVPVLGEVRIHVPAQEAADREDDVPALGEVRVNDSL